MHEHAQDWGPPEEGSSSCAGLQEHPKLGLGAATPPGSSFCKSEGKVEKNQCRRAGELEDQSRKTEVSLATQGTTGTNSLTATR